MSALRQEIEARNQEFMKAFQSGDAAAAAANYAEDCLIVPHGHERIKGRSGAEAWIKQDMVEGVKSILLTIEEVNGEGNWAFERGNYRVDGAHGVGTGSYLIIWKKVGGKWYIHNNFSNDNKPEQ